MKLITILGPTAVGKTRLAVELADKLNGEIISADSRQVYRMMDVGTGKDLQDYKVNGRVIPYHLIDILEAGEEYNLFQFQNDFYAAYRSILERKKTPVLCGGTGMYLQAALAKERLLEVPVDEKERELLNGMSDQELQSLLINLAPNLHNTTDLIERNRTIRAIEIERYKLNNETELSPIQEKLVFGIKMEREVLRSRIEERLIDRLDNGMIEEVELLIKKGLSHQQLEYYGLEYRFISRHLLNELKYDEMYTLLLQAIQRFAKKQMTWYRRMERMGETIYWIDAQLNQEEKLAIVLNRLSK